MAADTWTHHPDCPAKDGNRLKFKCECSELWRRDRPLAAQTAAAISRKPLHIAPPGARTILYDVRLTMGQRDALLRLIRRLKYPTVALNDTDVINLDGAYLRLESGGAASVSAREIVKAWEATEATWPPPGHPVEIRAGRYSVSVGPGQYVHGGAIAYVTWSGEWRPGFHPISWDAETETFNGKGVGVLMPGWLTVLAPENGLAGVSP